jgi:hypothetical protein
MSRLFYHVMQDNAGNLLFDVSGTMRLAGSGTLATIYGDEALTIPIANPMTNHPSFGSFKCFLGAGDYDFYMAKSGYTFETLTGVQGHGTMAQQDAGAVAITGGTALLTTLGVSGSSSLSTPTAIATPADATYLLKVGAPPSLGVLSPNGQLVVNTPTPMNGRVNLLYDRGLEHGISLRGDDDVSGTAAIAFFNAASTQVGSITTTAAATAFNTTSDARLKTAVTTLVGELAVIRALRPVRFRWLADDSEGVGFIAGEVQEHVQGVITGEPDAVEADGVTIRPQMIDMSRLVPWLVGAVQTLAARVETLTERVAELEAGA